MAQYEVVPFIARIESKQGVNAAADQLKGLINEYAAKGWRYLQIESIEIHQAGSAGCFGIGATPGTVTRFDMAVFEK